MFSFNQPNCITHCLLHEAPRRKRKGDWRVADLGWVNYQEGAFPISKGILEKTFWCMYVKELVQHRPRQCRFLLSERRKGPVWIQGQTGDRHGAQTDYVILVMNASSTLRASAALKAEHSPSWTMLSLIMCNALGSAFLPSFSSSFSTPTTSSSSFSSPHPHWPYSSSRHLSCPTRVNLSRRYITNALRNT